jgi:hypothetical protein
VDVLLYGAGEPAFSVMSLPFAPLPSFRAPNARQLLNHVFVPRKEESCCYMSNYIVWLCAAKYAIAVVIVVIPQKIVSFYSYEFKVFQTLQDVRRSRIIFCVRRNTFLLVNVVAAFELLDFAFERSDVFPFAVIMIILVVIVIGIFIRFRIMFYVTCRRARMGTVWTSLRILVNWLYSSWFTGYGTFRLCQQKTKNAFIDRGTAVDLQVYS